MKHKMFTLFLGLAFFAGVQPARGQAILTNSLSEDGVLACSGLQTGTLATVEWASSLAGPWQTNWAGLTAVTVSSNGTITVSVPMFYRVRGVAATNATPTGMALIPAGSFQMGDSTDTNIDGNAPVHSVYVSAFYMDQTDVTYSFWQHVYSWAIANGYSFDNTGSGKAANHPVQTIDWYDVVKWCNARSELEGRTPAYYTDGAQMIVYRTGDIDLANDNVNWRVGYRLPTEAEWEKAARGGLRGQRFPSGNTISWSQANYYGDPLSLDPNGSHAAAYDLATAVGYDPMFSDGADSIEWPFTSPVTYFAPNGYGLNDMAGNVWQWCWDWDGAYGSGSDPRGPTSGSYRVFRGGCWIDDAFDCRTAYRGDGTPRDDYGYDGIGFRSVLPAGQ